MSWLKKKQASRYFGVSPRTLGKLLDDGLPHSRLPTGTILIELEAGDQWLRNLAVDHSGNQQIIDELLEGY